MSTRAKASRCRQKIGELLEALRRDAQAAQGYTPLVRGSLFRYRRRCGKKSCRCALGKLHVGRAFSIRAEGRSRTVSLAGVDCDELARGVSAHRELRRARAEMVRTFGELLRQVDLMEKLRAVDVKKLKRTESGA